MGVTTAGWAELVAGALILASLAVRACRRWWADYRAAAPLDQPDPLDEHARVALAALTPDALDGDLSDRRIAAVVGHWRALLAGDLHLTDPRTASPEE